MHRVYGNGDRLKPGLQTRVSAARNDSHYFEMIAGLELQRRKFRRGHRQAIVLDHNASRK